MEISKAITIIILMFSFVVKFIIMPEGHVQSMTCSLKQSFIELRNHFASELNQPPQVILMLFDGKDSSVIHVVPISRLLGTKLPQILFIKLILWFKCIFGSKGSEVIDGEDHVKSQSF